MATKNKVVEVEVNHTIDQMILHQKCWIQMLKKYAMQGMLSPQEIDGISINEDILAVLEMSKKIGKHQGFGN